MALDIANRVRASLASFEPYDPAFTPCRINLSANENTREMPDGMLEQLKGAVAVVEFNRYPDPLANNLRDVLAARHGVERANIIVGNGGDELLFNTLFAFGGPGHSVVTAPPDFAEYANFAAQTETPVVQVWRDADTFALDADALVAAAKEAALVILTSPNNPTGGLVDQVLVGRLLGETNALILIDEAYVEFAGEDASVASWVPSNPRLIVLRTLSKAFGMAGLRVGYLVADPDVVAELSAVRQIYSVDVYAQAAAEVAVKAREQYAPIVADIRSERERLFGALAELDKVMAWPSSANFLLVRVPNAARVRQRLRDDYSILVRDFSAAPGLADCLRITVGTREENDAVLDALAALVGEDA